MFGSHLSIAGGLHRAIEQAEQLGLRTVQIFTRNQRQWNVKPLTKEQTALWKQHLKASGLKKPVSHDSYLINLANPDPKTHARSMKLMTDELQRCEALGIGYLVAHPGAHLGEGESAGLKRIARSLDQLHENLPGYKVRTCLEITAGQGTNLGYTLEHLRDIIDAVREPDRLAVCLDTAHALEAGYPLDSEEGARQFLREVGRTVGLRTVKVWHLNDSKTPRGSRVDRHAHIGQGHIALDAFAVIVNHRGFASVPKILETPKEDAPDGTPMDTVNLNMLRSLMK